jgi:hypothetical protein
MALNRHGRRRMRQFVAVKPRNGRAITSRFTDTHPLGSLPTKKVMRKFCFL